MPADLPLCPSCNSKQIVKNGKIHNGKQNYKCRECDRQFGDNPYAKRYPLGQNKIITQSTKNLIDKLLLEKIPLAGIATVAEVSEPWLQSYVNNKVAFRNLPVFLPLEPRKIPSSSLKTCDRNPIISIDGDG